MLRRITLVVALWLAPIAALAQSSPGLQNGDIPTMLQWNLYFQQKMDSLGSPALTIAGGSLTGKLNFLASTTGTADV